MKKIANSAGDESRASGETPDSAPRSNRLRVVIAGGGTGGHVYPALALADALIDRGVSAERIHLIGARRGIEARLFPGTAFSFTLLSLRGLDRGRNLVALWGNVVAIASLMLGVLRVTWRFLRNRPHCVVGVGGYASAPCVLAANILRIPVVVHEQNALPGLVNRCAVRLGARAAISLPGTPLKGGVLTGNPVRSAISEILRTTDPLKPVLGIVGGSLGAGRLNDAALGLASRWGMRSDVSVRHVTGPRFLESCKSVYESQRSPSDVLDFQIVGYEEQIESLYSGVSLLVCRSGALTVAEICAAGVPSILIPWPGAAGDHQRGNAEALVRAGGAVLLLDADCDAAKLDSLVSPLLADAERLGRMSAAALELALPDAARDLAILVEEFADAST
ncbi:MAG: UDP-N-acetylglucosamine--N-acetylmuramyl-(pentapeptide) pyrophosphoryl-undecaprenol N-acetylglucosamine transferase [Actinomycetes bacterium]